MGSGNSVDPDTLPEFVRRETQEGGKVRLDFYNHFSVKTGVVHTTNESLIFHDIYNILVLDSQNNCIRLPQKKFFTRLSPQ